MRFRVSVAAGTVFVWGSVTAPARAENLSFRSIFYVDDYGAVHDGIQDDWSPISAAIEDASVVGGIVQLGAGVYRVASVDENDVAFAIDAPILIRGVGMSDVSVAADSTAPRDSLQTIVDWDAPAGIENPPVLLKVGRDDGSVEGFGLENLSISSVSGAANHVVWWVGVSRSHMDNVNIKMTTAADSLKAAFYLETNAVDAPTRSNRISRCWFLAPNAATRRGFGVLIESTVLNGVNWGNSFYDCKFNNARPPGADLMIRSTVSDAQCGGHQFINCRLDGPQDLGNDAGIILDNVDQVLFLNTTVDLHVTSKQVQLRNGCTGVMFMGSFDGVLTDDQVDPNLAGRVGTQAITGNVPPLKVPYLNLRRLNAQPSAQDGTLWFGGVGGSEDTLFVRINGALRAVDAEVADSVVTRNNIFAREAACVGVACVCSGQTVHVGTVESAGQTIKHRAFLDWDISFIPFGATVENVEVEINVTSGMSSGTTNVQIKRMTQEASVVEECLDLFNSINATAVYVTAGKWHTSGQKRLNLGSAAAADLQGQIEEGWFSIGLKTQLEEFEDTMTIAGSGQKLHVTFAYPD